MNPYTDLKSALNTQVEAMGHKYYSIFADDPGGRELILPNREKKYLGQKLRKVEQLAEKFRKLRVDTEKERVSREDN